MKKQENNFSVDDLKYTLNKLYKCRDLEITNLWQRSVFLSVFLILIFTAYGIMVIKMVDVREDYLELCLLHEISIFLTGVGLIFSVIWVLMSKASKAWYEVYEKAISEFEYKYHKDLKLPYKNIMGEMSLDKVSINNSFLSTKAGAYSPSRINIAIGQLCFWLWLIAMLFHITCNAYIFYNDLSKDKILIAVTYILPIVIFSITILLVKAKYLKSSFISA